MALKKSDLYRTLWASCDELRGGMDASEYKDYVLMLLFIRYVSDKYAGQGALADIEVPAGASFADLSNLKGGALREALINAVIHKDYASGNPIQISVYDDQLMIWNNGELPPDWTAETLTSRHTSRPFNPDVAGTFFRSGLIEAWGRGIERIVSSCRRNGTPGPTFAHEPGGLWVTFPFAAVSTDTGEVSTDTHSDASTDTQLLGPLHRPLHPPLLRRPGERHRPQGTRATPDGFLPGDRDAGACVRKYRR